MNRTILIPIFATLLLLAALAAGGCNIVGPVAYFIHGPAKSKKLYELDSKKPTVIFIDDRQNRIPRRALRLAIAEQAQDILLEKKVLEDMISANSALLAAAGDKHTAPQPISEIGRAIEADIVIFATVDSFTLSPNGQVYAPQAQLRIKVISVADDTRLWPEDPMGHPIRVQARAEAKEHPSSVAARHKAEDDLARQIGIALAQLFYDHETPRGIRTPD
jgi:hypothetical protein